MKGDDIIIEMPSLWRISPKNPHDPEQGRVDFGYYGTESMTRFIGRMHSQSRKVFTNVLKNNIFCWESTKTVKRVVKVFKLSLKRKRYTLF